MGRSHGARARGSERRRGRIRGRQGDQSYRSPAQEREGGLERVLRNTSYRTWSRIQREKRMYVDVPFTLCCLNDQLIIISLLVLLVRAMASLRSGLTLVFCRGFFLSHFFVTLFGFRDSHERRYCDTQKAQKKALCGQQVSGIRGPRWLLFVVVCLVVAMLTRSFLPLAALHPPFPRCSVRPATCSLDEEPTESGVCRGRTGGGRGGKVKRGSGLFGRRRLVDCGRRFPGSVSACVYKGFGQNFPLFQSSLEIPWSPSLPPRHRHTLSVTLLPLPSYPSLYACTLLYPAK